MGMRKTLFVSGEFYHVYNRGVDKRVVFNDDQDIERFFQSMSEFNTAEPIGSIYENSFRQLGSSASKLTGRYDNKAEKSKPLVRFVAYCLNPNHYHFLVKQVADKGIEKLMQRIGTGYTNYFNNKNKRTGSLFQGKFKAIHIDSNEYLLHLSAYVNLNGSVHQLGSSASKLVESMSSWGEYTDKTAGNKPGNKPGKNIRQGLCEKSIILEQFRSRDAYKKFALESLKLMKARKKELQGIRTILLE